MRITTAGRYAVRAMLDLTQHQSSEPVLRQDIAERQQISAEYIAQLFRLLAKDGLVHSVLGPGGGYLWDGMPLPSALAISFARWKAQSPRCTAPWTAAGNPAAVRIPASPACCGWGCRKPSASTWTA